MMLTPAGQHFISWAGRLSVAGDARVDFRDSTPSETEMSGARAVRYPMPAARRAALDGCGAATLETAA
jgi:hypothetical protein